MIRMNIRRLLMAASLAFSTVRAMAAEDLSTMRGEPGPPYGMRKLMDTPLRDPAICRGPDGSFYLTGTSDPFWGFNNENGIRVWKSKDMVKWEALGTVWKYGESAWHKKYLEAKKPLWAPEIHYAKGTFWLTYSMPGWKEGDPKGLDPKNSGSGLLKSVSGKAEGPYVDVLPNERLGDEIDASLFEDDDGTIYFLWHSGKIAKMKPDMSGLAEPYRWLKPTAADTDPKHHSGLCAVVFGKGSFDHVGYEGMFMFKRRGLYYLCCSENFQGRYSCSVATSTNIFGPYSARYEAIPNGGHNTFFQDGQGQWWSTYFGPPWSERAAVMPISFDADGKIVPGELHSPNFKAVASLSKDETTSTNQSQRWSAEQAWAWYKRQPWLVGFNFVPSTACNTTEMWSEETFDEATIDKELGMGAKLGFNSCRVFIQYIVWKHDPEGLKSRFDRFLAAAARHEIRVIPVLFDDCAFGDPQQFDPYLGKQREPIPGMCLPSWTPSPGLKLGRSLEERPVLERYVRDLVGHFRADSRILLWDLYNEPVLGRVGTPELVRDVFQWARAEQPTQPLTIGVWSYGENDAINVAQRSGSDVISFHRYAPYSKLRDRIAEFKKYGRPVICTEWMARPLGGKWGTDLPLFKEQGVGCFNWGLVNGRTQCHFHLSAPRGSPEPKVWFHDLFHNDGTPYDLAEHDAIRKTTADKTLDWSKCDYTKMVRPAFTDGTYRLSDGWTRWSGAGPNGNRLFYANEAGKTVTATVTGTCVALIHKAGPDCGIVSVTIDGKSAGEFDTYSTEVDWNRRATVAEGLSDGPHELIVTVTGRRRPPSSDGYIQVVDIAGRGGVVESAGN